MISPINPRPDGQSGQNRAGVAPHPLASDLTDDPTVSTHAGPKPRVYDTSRFAEGDEFDLEHEVIDQPTAAQEVEDAKAARTASEIGRQMIVILLLVAVAGAVLAAVLTQRWSLLWAGLVLFVPFMLLLLAPVWLAASTKIAQDETVRTERSEH